MALLNLSPDLSNAVQASLPNALKPQLAKLASKPPTGKEWIVETKLDGYRMLARVENGKARLITRGGHDWTDKIKSLGTAVEGLGIKDAWFDGEIVVMNGKGLPDFNALQNAIGNKRSAERIVYFMFDAPYYGGLDLRKVPLWSRRALLQHMLEEQNDHRVRFSQTFTASPAEMLEAARQAGMEGVMLKRMDAPYVSGRSDTWLKLKCSMRQEFVICGFTDRSGSQREVGGLLLSYYEHGTLTYAGNVGTGWDAKTAEALHAKLVAIEMDDAPLDARTVKPGRWSRRPTGTERWVSPELIAEVAFSEWTPDGQVRHPSFTGLRSDRRAKDVARELPDG